MKNSMVVLSQVELNQVSGAGSLIGDAILGTVYLGNAIINTPLFGVIGNTATAIGLPKTHYLVDQLAFNIPSLVGIAVGQALGGTLVNPEPLHVVKETGEGLYS